MQILFTTTVVCLLISPLFAQDAVILEGQKAIEHYTRFYTGNTIKRFSKKISNFTVENQIFSNASPSLYAGVASIGTDSGIVFSAKANEIKRFCKLENAGAIEGSPAVTRDYVFVGFRNNLFAAFSKDSGKLLWKYETKGPVATTPLVHDKFVYFTTSNGYCYSLNAETGAFKWRFNVLSKASSPAYDKGVSFDKDIVYVGNDRQYIFAINAKNGDQIWQYIGAGGQPLLSDLRVFASEKVGSVAAIDKLTGHLDWHFKGNLVPGTTEFALSNNTLVFGNGTSIIALDSRSGEGFKWQKDLSQPLACAPIIVGDVIYSTSQNGKLYTLELETGKEYSQLDLGFAPQSSPAFGKDGILYPRAEKILIIGGQ